MGKDKFKIEGFPVDSEEDKDIGFVPDYGEEVDSPYLGGDPLDEIDLGKVEPIGLLDENENEVPVEKTPSVPASQTKRSLVAEGLREIVRVLETNANFKLLGDKDFSLNKSIFDVYKYLEDRLGGHKEKEKKEKVQRILDLLTTKMESFDFFAPITTFKGKKLGITDLLLMFLEEENAERNRNELLNYLGDMNYLLVAEIERRIAENEESQEIEFKKYLENITNFLNEKELPIEYLRDLLAKFREIDYTNNFNLDNSLAALLDQIKLKCEDKILKAEKIWKEES
jgi:hypothetical protein